MNEETQIFTRENPKQNSHVFSISVRGWLALGLIVTICCYGLAEIFMAVYVTIQTGNVANLKVSEPLYTMSGMALAYYFGQQKMKGT